MSNEERKMNTIPYDAGYQKLASFFSCGNKSIDNFLQGSIALNPYVGKTYIMLNDEGTEIIGFYNICTGSIEVESDGMRTKMGGAIHINEFAVDQRFQRAHLSISSDSISVSDILLADCLTRVESMLNQVGFSFITLQSTLMGRSLYERFDFSEIEEDMHIPAAEKEIECIPMYLCLEEII